MPAKKKKPKPVVGWARYYNYDGNLFDLVRANGSRVLSVHRKRSEALAGCGCCTVVRVRIVPAPAKAKGKGRAAR